MDVKALTRNTYKGTEILLCRTRAISSEAELVGRIVERWGCVAGAPDGEDSSGRQKFRLMTPDELVSRACETAEKLFAAFEKRGWVENIPLPTFNPDDE